jgi:hypothetical protein
MADSLSVRSTIAAVRVSILASNDILVSRFSVLRFA